MIRTIISAPPYDLISAHIVSSRLAQLHRESILALMRHADILHRSFNLTFGMASPGGPGRTTPSTAQDRFETVSRHCDKGLVLTQNLWNTLTSHLQKVDQELESLQETMRTDCLSWLAKTLGFTPDSRWQLQNGERFQPENVRIEVCPDSSARLVISGKRILKSGACGMARELDAWLWPPADARLFEQAWRSSLSMHGMNPVSRVELDADACSFPAAELCWKAVEWNRFCGALATHLLQLQQQVCSDWLEPLPRSSALPDDGPDRTTRVSARLEELDVVPTMTTLNQVMEQLCEELDRILLGMNAELVPLLDKLLITVTGLCKGDVLEYPHYGERHRLCIDALAIYPSNRSLRGPGKAAALSVRGKRISAKGVPMSVPGNTTFEINMDSPEPNTAPGS